jgi:hypothetical protein
MSAILFELMVCSPASTTGPVRADVPLRLKNYDRTTHRRDIAEFPKAKLGGRRHIIASCSADDLAGRMVRNQPLHSLSTHSQI